jgi:hypothetical protein
MKLLKNDTPKKSSSGKIVAVSLSEVSKDELDRYVASDDKSGRDFKKYLRKLGKNDSVILNDPRVDDRDFLTAPNYFTWCTSKKYLGAKPYPKQLQLGINLFGDACPRCSDMNYVENIPFDEDIWNIRDHITFFKHGVCPKCKYTKSEAISDGELTLKSELVAVVGQRGGKCIPGNALVECGGLKRLKTVVDQKFRTVEDENGDYNSVTNHWSRGKKPTLKINLSDGSQVCCTYDHQIFTATGCEKKKPK